MGVQVRGAVIASPAGVDGSVQRGEQALLALVREPKRAADAPGPVKRAVEPFRDPGPHRRGGRVGGWCGALNALVCADVVLAPNGEDWTAAASEADGEVPPG